MSDTITRSGNTAEATAETGPKIRLGVSACLMGERVRYDGDHRRQDTLLAFFEGKVEWLPICPEVELGLGVPRETIGLREVDGSLQLIAHRTRRDLTEEMRSWAARRLDELPRVDGLILKARSPSCGVGSAEVEDAGRSTDGLWAAAIRARFPAVPVAEETELQTTKACELFLQRVLVAAGLAEEQPD